VFFITSLRILIIFNYKLNLNLSIKELIVLRYRNKRVYSKENYLKNGSKTQNQFAKNSFSTTIEEPGINESGIEAKKKGF